MLHGAIQKMKVARFYEPRCILYQKLSQFTKGNISQSPKITKIIWAVLNSRLALARQAILNTWNKNSKFKVTWRNICKNFSLRRHQL